MSIDINYAYWLQEAEEPVAGQAPGSDPNVGAAVGNLPAAPPGQGGPPTEPSGGPGGPPLMGSGDQEGGELPDVTGDPVAPEMPDEQSDQDFETWKQEFLRLAIKGDTMEMLNSIQVIRDMKLTEAPHKKFVEDNWQIIILRQNAHIDKASKEIRKLIKQQLDRNNPGSSIMQHIVATMEQADVPMIRDVFVKLSALYGMKADLHRKFLAALTGSVQVGGGGLMPDIAYSEKEYSVRMFTRFATQFGEITLGKWSLLQDDPERYLSEPEIERLTEGSPEEKQVLRRRIVIESIGDRFKDRSFLINVATPEGVIYAIGWDITDSLLAGYKEGKLIVRSRNDGDSEAMINDDGVIVPLLDLNIYYLKETGETDEHGRPETKEVPFMERRDGMLSLVASVEIVRDLFAGGLQGCFFKELPFNGNPSDIQQVTRAIPNIEEILMRRIN